MQTSSTSPSTQRPSEKGYFAFCAELYGPKGEGATPEEAEADLVRSIKQFLQQKRDEGIAEAKPGAAVATVTIDEAARPQPCASTKT